MHQQMISASVSWPAPHLKRFARNYKPVLKKNFNIVKSGVSAF